MHKRLLKIVHALMATIFGVSSLALIALGWRLAQGPIALPQITPYIAAALNSGRDDLSVSLEQVLIAWNADALSLDVELKDVVLSDAEGEAIRVPTAAIGLSGRALFSGQLAPVRVGLRNTIVTIIVYEDGRFALSGTVAEQDDDAKDVPAQERTPISPLLLALLGPPDYQSPLGFLENVELQNSLILIENRQTHSNWAVNSNRVAIMRDKEGAHSVASGQISRLDVGGIALPPTPLEWESYFDHKSGELTVEFNFDGLSIGDLVAQFVGVDFLKGSDAPVTGRVSGTLQLDPEKGARLAKQGTGVEFEFDLGAGQILAGGGLFSAPFDIYQGRIVGTIAPDFKRLDLSQITLSRGPFVIDGTAAMTGSGVVDDAGFPSPSDWAIDGALYLDGLTVQQLKQLWPDRPKDGARRWVDQNMDAGRISNGRFRIAIPRGFIGSGDRLPSDAIELTFDLSDGVAHLLRPLPPLTGAFGRGRLTATGFSVSGISGQIDGLTLSGGRFEIPDFTKKGAPANISLSLDGALPQMMAFLDKKPFGYPSKAGLDPADFKGRAQAQAKISLPLVNDLKFSDVSLDVKGQALDAVLPDIVPNMSFTHGDIDIHVTQDGLVAKGPIRVNDVPTMALWTEDFGTPKGQSGTFIKVTSLTDEDGRAKLGYDLTPYVTGLAEITAEVRLVPQKGTALKLIGDFEQSIIATPMLNWGKPSGEPMGGYADLFIPFNDDGLEIRLAEFRSAGFHVKGNAKLGQGSSLVSVNADRLIAGPENELTITTTPLDDGSKSIAVMAVRADLRKSWLAESVDVFGPRQSSSDNAPPKTGADQQVSRAVTQYDWIAGTVTLEGQPTIANMTGRFYPATAEDGTEGYLGRLNAMLFDDRYKEGDQGAPLEITLKPLSNGAQFLNAETKQGGALVRLLGFVDQARGGDLLLETVIPDLASNDQGAGRLRVNDIRILKLPVLAQIINVSSLSGLASSLQGEGLLFNEITVPFTIAQNEIRITDGRAFGPSVGIKGRGIIGLDGSMNVDGTLAPAYTLNAALGRIPVIGELLVGGEGEGLFAVNFAVNSTGGEDAAKVTVNPLSALTPGFLRGIFGDSNPATNPDADAARNTAQDEEAAEATAGSAENEEASPQNDDASSVTPQN